MNCLNILVAIYETYDLLKRSLKIVKLEGYCSLLFYYPTMILFNGYKQNDIFMNLMFISILEQKGFKILLYLSKVVFYITVCPKILALIYLVLYITTEWQNISKTLDEWKKKKTFLETVSAMFFLYS